MPILAGLLFAFFEKVFDIIIKKVAVNYAIALSYLATILAAYGFISSAISVATSALMPITPSAIQTLFSIVIPPSLPSHITAFWVADATLSGWAWFQHRIPILAQLSKI